jgi:hypothetical protein
MCRRTTTDPLSLRLFKEFGLSLLKVAYPREKLAPGHIVVTYPSEQRDAVVYSLAQIIVNPPPIQASDGDYVLIQHLESSHQVTAQVLAEIGGILGPGADIEAVKGALSLSGSSKFSVSLPGARRAALDVATVDEQLREAKLTDTARDLIERGCRLHLVTSTVIAKTLSIEGDKELSAKAFASLQPIAKGELKLGLKGKNRIEMVRQQSALVIGFQALELIEVDDEIRLNGLTRKLLLRGKGGPDGENPRAALAIYSKVTDFAAGNTIFVRLTDAG